MLACNCALPSINPKACESCPSWIQLSLPFPSDTGTAASTPMQPDYFQKKQDSGKLRWDLLPLDLIEGIVRVLDFGARKYSPNSWKTVPDAIPRYTAALLRHLAALQSGEYIDPESGLPHIYHVACNALFLIHFYEEAHSRAS